MKRNQVASTNILYILIGIVIAGICWYLGNGLYGSSWYCLWIAPAPVLMLALRVKTWQAYVIAYIAYAIGRLSWYGYIATVVNTGFALQLVLTLPLLFAFLVLIARAVVLKTDSWLSVFAYPVLITLSEFVMLQTSSDGSASSIAYTQMNFLPVIQIASVTGLLGITLFISFIPSAIAVGWHFYTSKNRLKPLVITSVLLFTVVLLFGLIRLGSKEQLPTIKAGIVSLPEKEHILSHHPDFTQAMLVTRDYAKAINQLATEGAQIVLIPERALNINDSINAETLSMLKQPAQQHDIYIAAAYTNFKEAKPHNSILIIDNRGNVLVDYNKQHLVNIWEDWFAPDNRTGLFSFNNVQAGVAICKDLDFPETINQYGKSGIGFMLIPAWDFEVDDWLHCRMAVLRGVENGFAEVRAARQGRLTVSDAYGRILFETSTAKGEAANLIGNVPTARIETMYAKYGNWFGWLNCIAAVCLAGMFFLKRKNQA